MARLRAVLRLKSLQMLSPRAILPLFLPTSQLPRAYDILEKVRIPLGLDRDGTYSTDARTPCVDSLIRLNCAGMSSNVSTPDYLVSQ